jgi:hypothetical protein
MLSSINSTVGVSQTSGDSTTSGSSAPSSSASGPFDLIFHQAMNRNSSGDESRSPAPRAPQKGAAQKNTSARNPASDTQSATPDTATQSTAAQTSQAAQSDSSSSKDPDKEASDSTTSDSSSDSKKILDPSLLQLLAATVSTLVDPLQQPVKPATPATGGSNPAGNGIQVTNALAQQPALSLAANTASLSAAAGTTAPLPGAASNPLTATPGSTQNLQLPPQATTPSAQSDASALLNGLQPSLDTTTTSTSTVSTPQPTDNSNSIPTDPLSTTVVPLESSSLQTILQPVDPQSVTTAPAQQANLPAGDGLTPQTPDPDPLSASAGPSPADASSPVQPVKGKGRAAASTSLSAKAAETARQEGPDNAQTAQNQASGTVGTPAAQQEPSMKKADKTLKVAEAGQQNLPSDTSSAATRQDLTPSTPASTASHSQGGQTLDSTISHTTAVSDAAAASAPQAGAGSERMNALERTHDLVALHAIRLGQSSGSDTLRVVLQPGSGTQLSLELRRSDSGIQAQATLNRGDFQFFNQHWNDLQQQLEPRGVHLAALECSSQSAGDNSQFNQSNRQAPDEQSSKSAFADFAFGDSMTETPAARQSRTKTHRGWETWA